MVRDGLFDSAELVVCDQCWQLAGAATAVRAKLADIGGDGERLEPLLVFDPAVETLLAGPEKHDLLHPVDRLLVESGVRWMALRHIAVHHDRLLPMTDLRSERAASIANESFGVSARRSRKPPRGWAASCRSWCPTSRAGRGGSQTAAGHAATTSPGLRAAADAIRRGEELAPE